MTWHLLRTDFMQLSGAAMLILFKVISKLTNFDEVCH